MKLFVRFYFLVIIGFKKTVCFYGNYLRLNWSRLLKNFVISWIVGDRPSKNWGKQIQVSWFCYKNCKDFYCYSIIPIQYRFARENNKLKNSFPHEGKQNNFRCSNNIPTFFPVYWLAGKRSMLPPVIASAISSIVSMILSNILPLLMLYRLSNQTYSHRYT